MTKIKPLFAASDPLTCKHDGEIITTVNSIGGQVFHHCKKCLTLLKITPLTPNVQIISKGEEKQ